MKSVALLDIKPYQLHDFPWEQTAEQLNQHISNKAW